MVNPDTFASLISAYTLDYGPGSSPFFLFLHNLRCAEHSMKDRLVFLALLRGSFDITFSSGGNGVTPLRFQRIELTELSGRIKTRRATARAG